MNESATAAVIKELPLILRDKPRTQKDIWQYLLINDKLKQQLVTTTGKTRVGILQGITTRIKDGRLPEFKLIKSSDGHTKLAYIGNTAYQRANYVHQLLLSIKELGVADDVKADDLWDSWDAIETKLIGLDKQVTVFMKKVQYAKPTEVFRPAGGKNKTASYPISKFKHNK
ncbi:hypothetical protein [Lactiplantibacillus herbarum]|uniref:hypothetical protein n=1 Tax=Lactiplantibacillus herbarum TaxID=1670446 RepID=UPI00064FD258|nr:hypothetical protein [Lactiplantibacillus herbarum]